MRSLLAAAALVATCTAPSLAATAPHLLTLTSTATVEAVPDQAELRAGVVAQGASAAAALADDSQRMQAVFAALEKLGVPRRAIQTSDFSINPDYNSDGKQPRQILSYTVTNTVTVTLKGVDQVGTVLDRLVSAGANQIYGVSFSIADPAPLLAKARAEAVHQAQEAAQTYAAAAGVSLGPVASISAGDEPVASPAPMMMRAMAAAPIAAGTQRVSASVTMSWELK